MRTIYLGLLAVSWMAITGSPALGLVVPDSECTCNYQYWTAPPCHITADTCNRTDGGVTTTDPGDPDSVSGGSMCCDNTGGPCCEQNSPLTCSQELRVSYTEAVSVSVASGIEAGIPGIQASLSSSIGHSTQREQSYALNCQVGPVSGCATAGVEAQMSITVGIETQMVHSYSWTVEWTGCEDNSPTQWPCAQTRTSTASGSSWGSGSCVGTGPC